MVARNLVEYDYCDDFQNCKICPKSDNHMADFSSVFDIFEIINRILNPRKIFVLSFLIFFATFVIWRYCGAFFKESSN